jgi:uncharacterized membrane protein YjfL (UPF0719 family)
MAEAWIWGVVALVGLMLWRRALRALGVGAAVPANVAGRVLEAAETFGVLWISAAVTRALADLEPAARATWTAISGGTAVVVVVVSGRLVSRVFLQAAVGASVAGGNTAAAVAAAGHVLAASFVAADCLLATTVGEWAVSVAAFTCASAALHGLVSLFRALTVYDDAAEIRGGNLAAGVSHAGVCAALGLVVGHAVHGEWRGFAESASAFGGALAWALALYPVRQALVETILLGGPPRLRGGRIDEGVGRDRDVGLAALEAASFLGMAMMARSLA